MDIKPRKHVLVGEEIGEEDVMEVVSWCIDGTYLPTRVEYKNFKKPQWVNGVNCCRALMGHEEWGLRTRLWIRTKVQALCLFLCNLRKPHGLFVT